MSMQLRLSPVQERAQKLQHTRNLRLPRKRMTQAPRQRPVPGSSGLSSGEKG